MNSMQIIPAEFIRFIQPIDFKSMYDLGNKRTGNVPYRVVWEKLGIEYDSIDLNGLNGALRYDLRKPIDLPARTTVMNLGTSEHIFKQEAVFRNVHNLSIERMIHMVPIRYERPRHGYWGYTFQFFLELAKLNDYVIEKLDYERKRRIICVAYRKTVFIDYGKKATTEIPFRWDSRLVKFLHRNKHGSGGVVRK